MTSALLSAAGLVVVLLLVVLGSMAVENWSRWRVRLRTLQPAPEPIEPIEPVVLESVECEPVVVGSTELGPAGADSAQVPVPAVAVIGPAPGSPWRPEQEPGSATEVLYVIDGRERADQLVGALLASYAASRASEANRAAAWVHAIDRPPGETGAEFEPGANLRGKPASAARLLACRVDDRCWVTLNPSVDIGRGLARRPPRGTTLAGVVALWAATRAAMSLVDDAELAPIVAAITTLEPQWRGTTAAPEVLGMLVACTEALDAGVGLRLQITRAAFGARGGELEPARAVDTNRSAPRASAPAVERGTAASFPQQADQTV